MLLEKMDEGWVKISSLENYIIIISIFYIISFNRRSRCHPSLICKKIDLARYKQQTIKSVSTNLATSFKKCKCVCRPFFLFAFKKVVTSIFRALPTHIIHQSFQPRNEVTPISLNKCSHANFRGLFF